MLLPLAVWAQTQVPEVRGGSRPYVPQSPLSLRVETRLVDVGVVVRDARGHAVPGLKQADFMVLDEGKERTITSFVVDTLRARPKDAAAGSAASPVPPAGNTGRPPRFVVLFFDDLNTYTGDLKHAQIAARRFVREGLSPGDRIAVMTSSSANSLEFTTDVPKIVDAIDRLKSHPRVPEAGLGACPRITPYQAYLIASKLDGMALKAAVDEVYACADDNPPPTLQTKGVQNNPVILTVKGQAEQTWAQVRIVSQTILDAVDAAVEHLSKAQGTRMLALVSSGFLAGTTERQQDLVIDHALRAGVVINALDAKGIYTEAPTRPLGERPTSTQARVSATTFVFELTAVAGSLFEQAVPLGTFTSSTGGLFFRNNNDLDLGFHEIGVEPEVTYHLGFSPSDVAADGKYHRLKVRLASADTGTVQARPGYFAPERKTPESNSSTVAADPRANLDRAVLSGEDLAPFPASVTVKPGKPITATAHIDIKGLKFLNKDGRRMQHLTIISALLDAQGNFVTGKEGTMDLALGDKTFASMSETGLSINLSLNAPPGVYRLREVVQEAVDGRIAATGQTVEIPGTRQ